MVDRSAEVAAVVQRVESQLDRLEAGDDSVRVADVEADLGEADELVAQLDVTARASADDAGRHAARLMRSVLQGLKDRKARFALVGRGGASKEENAFHSEFMESNARLESSTERLLDSRRTLAETESVASGITQDLLSQRATIESAHNKVTATGGMFGRAHRAMRAMERREVKNKVCVYVGVGIVCLALFVALIKVLAPRGSPAPAPAPAPAPPPFPPGPPLPDPNTRSPTPWPTTPRPSHAPTLHPSTRSPTSGTQFPTPFPTDRRRLSLRHRRTGADAR